MARRSNKINTPPKKTPIEEVKALADVGNIMESLPEAPEFSAPTTDMDAEVGRQLKISKLEAIEEKAAAATLKETFKYGREGELQLAKVDRDLFTEIEEKDSGNYIVSGIERKVTLFDFESLSLGLGRILYNQSVTFGNEKENSGISKGKAVALNEQSNGDYYKGEIVVTLNEICRSSYGGKAPTTAEKKAIEALLATLHHQPVKITFPNGDSLEVPLCVTLGKYKRKKDEATFYHLRLHPIFCHNVQKNFSEFPQDIMERLMAATKRTSPQHLRLLKLLGRQDKRKPFYRTIETLCEELMIDWEVFKKNRARFEKRLLSLFDEIKATDILVSYEVERRSIRGKAKWITNVVFHLNPDFPRKRKSLPPSDKE